ncbi:MAG: ferritin-like domain-containing protein [Fuerstiella sp.]|nr:ferritin-like domain-containing protein [Fuerstiella sp.]MCP4511817.1 ferritin-like domain-containing protein [Fuerstiella sp.]
MELRAFAEQVLLSDALQKKIQRPAAVLTDHSPGDALRVDMPMRPENLQFAARRTAPTMPKPQAFRDPEKRAVAHHIMANHELQALEVMAMVLLAFPGAPAEFRMGMAEIMFDEQRHTKLHAQRAEELGVQFGGLPVNSYIWNKARDYSSELEYIAGLPLVFEGANLDHTVEYEKYFLDHGDARGAAIMRAIHKDEITHVQFGLKWLRQLKDPSLTDFQAWQQALHWPIRPVNAKGDVFLREARRAAGMDHDFIDQLRDFEDPAPLHDSSSDAV